jgi:myosin heavy subunit
MASAQAMAKCLYERVFGWLLAKCNRAIGAKRDEGEEADGEKQANGHKETFVGVLDMAGFEIMARNSFEQLWSVKQSMANCAIYLGD